VERDNETRLAVYQIKTSCAFCRLKESCTPDSHVRQITRSLATWAEAEVGKFHRRISAIMFLAATLVCAVGLLLWAGKPGTGLFAIAQIVSVTFLISEIRAILEPQTSAIKRSRACKVMPLSPPRPTPAPRP